MATNKENELKMHLKIALEEIGEIKPWFDKETYCWIFEHPDYPVSCGEDTAEEVIAKYPLSSLK